MEKVYNKLVRDNIPEIIKANGEYPVTKILSDEDYKRELETKLKEECAEVLEASGKDRVEELADVLEIIMALAKIEKVSLNDVIAIAKAKSAKRGAFENKIFLEKVYSENSLDK